MYAMDRTIHLEHRIESRTTRRRRTFSTPPSPPTTSSDAATQADERTSPVHEFID